MDKQRKLHLEMTIARYLVRNGLRELGIKPNFLQASRLTTIAHDLIETERFQRMVMDCITNVVEGFDYHIPPEKIGEIQAIMPKVTNNRR